MAIPTVTPARMSVCRRGALAGLVVAAVLAALLPAATALAEHTAIQGTVTSAVSGEPLVGASVATVDVHGNPRAHSTTGADGGYTVGHLGPGSYVVTAGAEGYVTQSRDVTVAADSTVPVNFALQPSPTPDPEPEPEPDGACPGGAPAAPFTDRDAIPAAHRTNVDCAAHHEVVDGFEDGSYGPERPVRRDQMASFVARALAAAGTELPDPEPGAFRDVPAGSPHLDSIGALAAAGIVQGGPSGLPDDRYGPDLEVRRDQMASFLVRAVAFAGHGDLGRDEQAFDDVGAANPHYAAVNGAAGAGLASGVGDGRYAPAEGVRRDQLGTFAVRLLDLLAG